MREIRYILGFCASILCAAVCRCNMLVGRKPTLS